LTGLYFCGFKNSKALYNKGVIAMKQKYLIINDKKNKQIKIQEFAELNKEMLSLLCEEVYDYKTIKAAISSGTESLISALRTNNLYPPGIYAAKIASAVAELYKSKDPEARELFFDDVNLLAKNREVPKITEQLGDDSPDLDEMPDDNFQETFEDKDDLRNIDSPIKVDGDDFSDADGGS
jgi:hypothetical protein